ncbi:hypothetical protein [Seohaeicola sp. SP36]|nr:hypothetical protein [Seohaeicola sp. SP36]MDD9708375.1 hypothetical protein [Seohaeicola sp. 4SK31]
MGQTDVAMFIACARECSGNCDVSDICFWKKLLKKAKFIEEKIVIPFRE